MPQVQSPTPDTYFEAYRKEPTTTNLNTVVDSLNPVVHHALSSVGAQDDPALKIRARVLAAQAVKKYDPSAGANLATWTSNQLQPLRRMRREIQSPIKVPERTQLDALKLHRAEQEFYDEHNRLPDTAELADKVKLPVRRIAKIRRSFRRTPSESALGGMPNVEEPDHTSEAMDYVYRDSDHVDRRIIELKTGYGGESQMEPKAIAEVLKLTPSQLSRRSARIALRIQELEEALRQQ